LFPDRSNDMGWMLEIRRLFSILDAWTGLIGIGDITYDFTTQWGGQIRTQVLRWIVSTSHSYLEIILNRSTSHVRGYCIPISHNRAKSARREGKFRMHWNSHRLGRKYFGETSRADVSVGTARRASVRIIPCFSQAPINCRAWPGQGFREPRRRSHKPLSPTCGRIAV